ncbi:hemerythrin domain-containing protein [Cytobacillus sp. IB215665]|uniref:hemerythrin domain-containing protein n=1 Tax=Cytobacillus sp. IB215665 TaxID=3097357 RepID=UPI002A149C66|nr:hemerythrin domain-containing protein [Cytobacillus sp. IB215665]MDX8366874.1 hemerythrin domain-containing protein [Cytobacillus sp. IB215665]
MSGPSLRKLDAHQSIHEGAVTEGKELLDMLVKLYKDDQHQYAQTVAKVLVEHWETRTIAHADSEEEGFYVDLLDKNPNLKEPLTMLKRDHDLLRILVTDVKDMLKNEGLTEEVIDHFKAILIVLDIHNHDEEILLS